MGGIFAALCINTHYDNLFIKNKKPNKILFHLIQFEINPPPQKSNNGNRVNEISVRAIHYNDDNSRHSAL